MSETSPEQVAAEDNTVDVLTAFFVIVERSGRIVVATDSLPSVRVDHQATVLDVETYASQVAREAGRLLTISALAPAPEPTVGDRVADALAKRSQDEVAE